MDNLLPVFMRLRKHCGCHRVPVGVVWERGAPSTARAFARAVPLPHAPGTGEERRAGRLTVARATPAISRDAPRVSHLLTNCKQSAYVPHDQAIQEQSAC